jgi:hypothetical protein
VFVAAALDRSRFVMDGFRVVRNMRRRALFEYRIYSVYAMRTIRTKPSQPLLHEFRLGAPHLRLGKHFDRH